MSREPLRGLVSRDAAALYERVAAAGRLPVENTAALAELDAIGLTGRSPCHPGMVQPVPPAVAFDDLLASFQREFAQRQALLGAALAQAVDAHRESARSLPADHLVEVLADKDVLSRVAGEVLLSARREALEFALSTHGADLDEVELPLEPMVGRGVRYRVVYAARCLTSEVGREIIRLFRQTGEEQRIYSGWLTGLRVADDDLAVLRVGSGALLIRSRPLVALLRQWFELVWEHAAWPEDEETALSPLELSIVELQAAGHKDAAIARALGVSERTVRRRVAAILTALGAGTRFEAGVEAVRRGWLPTSDDGVRTTAAG